MIQLTDPADWHKVQLARAVPGARYEPAVRSWVVDNPTPRAAAVMLKLFPQLGRDHPRLLALREQLTQDVRPVDYATAYDQTVTAALSPAFEDNLAEQDIRLHAYQDVDLGYAVRYLEEHKAFYIGWERGLGKTLASCVLMDALNATTVLVVAPNTAKLPVWKAEIERFLPDYEVIVLGNTANRRNHAIAWCSENAIAGKPTVLVVHYEALAVIAGVAYKRKGDKGNQTVTREYVNGLEKEDRKRFRKVIGGGWSQHRMPTFDLVIADEAHRFANPDTDMVRAFRTVKRDKLVFLSGSVLQNKLEELWAQINLMFPNRYPSRWRDWNDRYLDYVQGYGKICVGVKAGREQAMREELGAFMVVRRKDDVLDLPARTDAQELLPLSLKQRKAYDELRAECITILEDDTKIKAEVGIAMMTKLRQIATGLDLITGEVADSTKLDRAVEIITDGVDDVFVVFGWYKSSLHALRDRLTAKGIESFLVTGDVPQAQRADAIARFQAGEGRVMLGTLATMGESVNLQRANNVIMLDRSWNPALNEQAEDRVHRQGQTRPVTVTHLIAEDTVDDLNVMPTLSNKQALRAVLLGGR